MILLSTVNSRVACQLNHLPLDIMVVVFSSLTFPSLLSYRVYESCGLCVS
jgi:hypothetical protein